MNASTQDRKTAVLARMGSMGFSKEELETAREILDETDCFAKAWKTRFVPQDIFDFLGYALGCVIGYHLALDIWNGFPYEELWRTALAAVAIPVLAVGTAMLAIHFAFAAFSFVTGFPALSLDEERIRVFWKTIDWNDVFLTHFMRTRPVYNPNQYHASFFLTNAKKAAEIRISDLGSGWVDARVAITACALARNVSVDAEVKTSILDNIPRRSLR